MPELPEVETIRRDLRSRILRKRITRAEILSRSTLKTSRKDFGDILRGNSFNDIGRIGKLLLFSLQIGGKIMLVHLGMTGQLIYRRRGGLRDKHTRLVICFADGSELVFNDIRKFGYCRLVDGRDCRKIVGRSFGRDALAPEFTPLHLQEFLSRRKNTALKAALLDQRLLAGIGNIYADEICFDAGISPLRRAGSITVRETARLYRSIKEILSLAVKHRGTTFRNYVDARGRTGGFSKHLKVYGRGGKPCLKCRRAVITKVRSAGRGTHYCAICQK